MQNKETKNLSYFFEGRRRRGKKCGKCDIQGASTCDYRGCGLHKSGLGLCSALLHGPHKPMSKFVASSQIGLKGQLEFQGMEKKKKGTRM